MYVNSVTLIIDMKILIKTIMFVVRQKAINSGMVATMGDFYNKEDKA